MKKKCKKYQVGGIGKPKPYILDEEGQYLANKFARDARVGRKEGDQEPLLFFKKNEIDRSFLDEKIMQTGYEDPGFGLASDILKGVNFGVGAIADVINNAKNIKQERERYFSSFERINDPSFIQNDLPIYTKFGGGFPRDKALKILRDKEVNGKPLTDKQRKFFAVMAFSKKKAEYGIDTTKTKTDSTAYWLAKDLEAINKGVKMAPYSGPGLDREQYLKHIDAIGYQSTQAPQAKDSSKNRQTTSTKYVIKKLGVGGDVEEVEGLPKEMHDQAWIEAEAGEVYKQPDGQVLKIDEDGDRHEDGGEMITNVERVLEDTSTTRKDKISKSLVVTPQDMKNMFGVVVKGNLSHSEALEVANAQVEKQTSKVKGKLKKALEALEVMPSNKYTKNSLELNTIELSKYPSKEDMFDTLFEHQESLKEEQNMKQAKYGISLPMAEDGLEILYKKANTIGASKNDILAFQKAFHSDPRTKKYAENLVANRGNITTFGKKNKYSQTDIRQNEDGLMGRTTEQYFKYFNDLKKAETIPTKRNIGPGTVPDILSRGYTTIDPSIEGNIEEDVQQPFKGTQYSDFNEPLNATDLLAPALAFLSADRIPANYNPSSFKKVDPRLENVLPYLQQGQRDFNSISAQLDNSGSGQANAVNLFAQKYATDVNTMATVADRNLQRQSTADMYNAQVSDKQSVADQQSRAIFETQQLAGIEAQRQQKLRSLDEIFQRVNLNRKQNREGDLLMKLFPNFDSRGNYNGNQRYIAPQTGSGATSATDAGRFKTVPVDLGNGKISLFTIDLMDPKQRPVSNNKDMTNTRNATPRYLPK